MPTATEFYEKAIAKLENYRENEPDKQKRDDATRKIQGYRIAIQQANFDEISKRTTLLKSLQTDLQGIIDSASSSPGLSDIIADLSDFANEITSAITQTP
jgi:hypothetical protein